MPVEVRLAGINRTADINADTLEIVQNLAAEEDTCKLIVELGDKPTNSQEIVITDGVNKKFAGTVKKVTDLPTPGGDLAYDVVGRDYRAMFDRRLVVETYVNTAADEIAKDIINKYCPGFTYVNMQSGAPEVERITFPYWRPSRCLQELADYVGWQWYIDYDKDVHLFPGFEAVAPIEINDSADVGEVAYAIETTDLANQVIVQGGKYLSDSGTIEEKADGTRRLWLLHAKPYELTVTVGGVPVTVGEEGKHNEAAFNYMVKLDDKKPYIRCSSHTTTPVSGTILAFTFKSEIDVITEVNDFNSQAAVAAIQGGDGIYQHTIVDETLVTIEAAEAAGEAYLREHANPRISGSFPTEVEGFAPGQIATFNLVRRGITGKEYLVHKVVIKYQAERWRYTVHFGGRLLGIDDDLKALVSAQQRRKITETSELRRFMQYSETVNLTEESRVIRHRTPFYVKSGPLFVRASVAYKQDGTQVATNQPRFEFDNFGNALGAVMVEEGTTNLIKNPCASSDLTYWYVNKNADSVASMTRVTNDGVFGSTCVECTRTTLVSPGWIVFQQVLYQYLSSPYFDTTKQYTLSFWARSVAGSNTLRVAIRDSNGTNTVLNDTTVTLTSNWQRYVITFTPLISGNQPVLYLALTADNTTFRITAVQLEQKPYATSFIDGTRSPETLTIPTAGVLSETQGTVECYIKLFRAPGTNRQYIFDGAGATNQNLEVYVDTDGKLKLAYGTGTATVTIQSTATLSKDTRYAVAWKWSAAGVKLFLNGEPVASDATAPGIVFGANAYYGSKADGTLQLDGLLDDLRISSRARTDEEILAGYQSGEPLEADADTTYKLDFDGVIQDIVTTPVCGFVVCA